MGLFLLILLLLLFLLLYPVIKAGFKVWMQMRQMNKAFQNAQSQYGGGTRGEQRRTSSTGNNEYRRHRRHGGKIFRPGDGEYVKFEGLDTGMYLVVPRQVTTYFYMYNFTPYLVSLPHNYYDPDKTDSSDEWVYTVEMGLKPGREERYGSIKIMKELTEMSMMPGNEATFVFQVDIETLKGDK